MRFLKRVGPLNLLLVMFPVALGLKYGGGAPEWVFIASCMAVIPLAGLMGRATEHISDRVGPGLGGLLNATFGNAAELIIAILALRAGLVNVVRASITGSILGNILLVLGAAFLAGGLKFKRQSFNPTAAGVSTTLLMLAASGLLFPAIYDFQLRDAAGHDQAKLDALGVTENAISVEIAVVLFTAYVLMLVFSLRTHKHLYSAEESSPGEPSKHDHNAWPMSVAIGVLVGATVLVGVASEMLVGSIEATRKQFGWTEEFVGVIVVAIVGNAAEHSTAILVAMKNRMELAFQIAIGSGLQVAVFVAPVLVFVSLLPGFPERLNLVFSILETAAVLVSVLAISMVAHDGESNWLEGVLLLALYVILGIAFYNLPEQEHPKATEERAAIRASGGRIGARREGEGPAPKMKRGWPGLEQVQAQALCDDVSRFPDRECSRNLRHPTTSA